MMEYSPGNPGTVKLICLEGTVRLGLAGRLGESVLIGPGQMLAVAANATSLPNPVTVDVKRILKTSKLVKEGDLESMGLIMETVETQQEMLANGDLNEGSPDLLAQQTGNPGLINSAVANAIQNRQDTAQPIPPPAPAPAPTPQPNPSPYYTPPNYTGPPGSTNP
jgi:hypothetical protein